MVELSCVRTDCRREDGASTRYGYQKDRNRMGSEDLLVGLWQWLGGCSEMNRMLERILLPQRRSRCREISKSNRPVHESLAIEDKEEQDPINHTTNRRCMKAWLE